MQVNNDAFGNWNEKKLAKRIVDECSDVVFGSDAHNISDSMPNWDVIKRKVKPELIESSDDLLDRFII